MEIFLQKELEEFKNVTTIQEKRDISEKIKKILGQKKIIVYGAGASGKVLASICEQLHIKIEIFVDRNYQDIQYINEIKVLPINELDYYKDDDILIIISIDSELFLEFKDEIEHNINTYCSKAKVIIYGRDLILALKYDICRTKFLLGHKFNLVDCINCGAESRGCEIFDEYLRQNSSKSMLDKSNYKMRYNKFFGYILSNICTLKCKHCCEMVPYYKTKEFVQPETIIKNCTKVADATGFTMYIELIGGEPFLHPNIAYILDALLQINDVGYIKVFTNGTVVPNDKLLKVLKNPRIVIVWSNYLDTLDGILLQKVNETRNVFQRENIDYIYSTSKTWLDFSSFDYVEKSEEDLNRDFEDCFIANCHRLYEGVLYRCPHQYAAMRLNKLEILENNCVDIEKSDSLEALSEQLFEFKNLNYVDACRYCVVPYKAQEVPAGEQLKGDKDEIF